MFTATSPSFTTFYLPCLLHAPVSSSTLVHALLLAFLAVYCTGPLLGCLRACTIFFLLSTVVGGLGGRTAGTGMPHARPAPLHCHCTGRPYPTRRDVTATALPSPLTRCRPSTCHYHFAPFSGGRRDSTLLGRRCPHLVLPLPGGVRPGGGGAVQAFYTGSLQRTAACVGRGVSARYW